MGVMSTLSDINEAVDEQTDRLDPAQEWVRRQGTRASPVTDDEEEFAQQATKATDAATDAPFAPFYAAGYGLDRAGVDTPDSVDRAAAGGEMAKEVMLEYPAALVAGTATGADMKDDDGWGVADPEDAETGWTPDGLETAEVGLSAVGVGRLASAGGRAAARKARAASAAEDTQEMSRLGTLRRVLSRGDDAPTTSGGTTRQLDSASDTRAASRSDDAAKTTRVEQHPNFSRFRSTNRENLGLPPGSGQTARGGADAAQSASTSWGRIATAGVAAGAFGYGAGALDMGGDASRGPFPQGYSIDHRYPTDPAAIRVREAGPDGDEKGFWVVLDYEGGSDGAVETQTLTADLTGQTTQFPNNQRPTFETRSAADRAWQQAVERMNDPAGQGHGGYTEQSRATPDHEWDDATVLHSLDHGWYLVEQSNSDDTQYRYLVAGRSQNGAMLFIGANGHTRTDAAAHPNEEEAMRAYDTWVGRAQDGNVSAAPDPSQDRPGESALVDEAAGGSTGGGGGGGGVLGGIGTAAAAGLGVSILAILVLGVL